MKIYTVVVNNTKMSSFVDIFKLYHEKLTDLIDNLIDPVLQQFHTLKELALSHNSEEENVSVNLLSQHDIKDDDSLIKLYSLRNELAIVIRTLKPRVTWIPETQENTIFSYQTGHTPWSLVLVAENWENVTIATQNEIMTMYKEGEIKQFPADATIGDSIFFLRNQKMNRGLITSVGEEWVGIVNIDNGHSFFCDDKEIFSPTLTMQSTPAQSLHCCVVNNIEFNESIWCTELENIFRSVIIECKLRFVKWSKDFLSVPPKFTVRLIAINDLDEEADLTRWLEEDILRPWKFEGLPSEKSATQFFGKRLKDPFITHRIQKCETTLDNDNNIAFHQQVLEERRRQFFLSSRVSSSTPNEKDSVDLNETKTAGSADLALEYQPKDDKFCLHYNLHNYCLKKNCDKLHNILPHAKKRTDDKTEVLVNSSNGVKLPAVGDSTVIKVLEVVGGFSFFGSFPTSCFKMDGRSITINQEMKRINDPITIESYECLPTTPKIGDIALAYCLDNKFYRAEVIGLTTKGFSVFLVDFGKTVEVGFESLKKMDETFLRYPFQAVRCRLAGISCTSDEETVKGVICGMTGCSYIAVVHSSSIQEEGCLNVDVMIPHVEKTLNELMVTDGGICDINTV